MSEFYGSSDEAENLKVLQHAIDIGCTFWDTAGKYPKRVSPRSKPCYNDCSNLDMYGCGHNEELIGKILKTQGDKVFICTKFGKFVDPTLNSLVLAASQNTYAKSVNYPWSALMSM